VGLTYDMVVISNLEAVKIVRVGPGSEATTKRSSPNKDNDDLFIFVEDEVIASIVVLVYQRQGCGLVNGFVIKFLF
jgi:hypothetical protein